MKRYPEIFTVADFTPLQLIDAAQFARGIFGGYKQVADWNYVDTTYRNIVFDTNLLVHPKQVLMTMLLYWKVGVSDASGGTERLILNACHEFIKEYPIVYMVGLSLDSAVKMVLLILKFHPVSQELNRLIKELLPALLGATNISGVGSLINQRPHVFTVNDTLRAHSLEELVERLNRHLHENQELDKNNNLLKANQDMLIEQHRRAALSDEVRLEKEALRQFLRDFLGFNRQEWEITMTSLENVSGLFNNECSLKGLHDRMERWRHLVKDHVLNQACCVPTHLALKTTHALFEEPIIIDGNCSSCWAIKQRGCSRRAKCKLHKVVVAPVPSAPPIEIGTEPQVDLVMIVESQIDEAVMPNAIPDCPLCLSCKVQIVIVPCGHFVCGACSFHIKDCPLCRGSIDKFVKCYF